MNAKILALTALSAAPAFADTLSLDLNNDAVRINYGHEFSRNYNSDFAWIHVKNLGNTFTGGILLDQKLSDVITAGIGGKAVFQQHDTLPDGTAVAVGANIRFSPPELKNVSFGGSAFYAPNVLSFGRMKNYREFELRASYSASEQFSAYVGYRNNRADYDNASSAKLYDGAMIGGEFHF